MGAPQSLHMAIVLKSCLDFLRGLHFGRGFIGQFFRRWTLVLASFGRRLGVWCGKRGTFGKDAYIERLFPGIGARLHSKEYVINASYAPASASRRSLQDLPSATAATGQTQLQAAAPSSTTPPVPTNLTVDARQDRVYLASVRSSANLSVYSRASNRHSIARTYSRESLYAPTSHPTRFPRAPHRQFGRGPSPSPSRERPSRSPSPTSRVHDHQLPRLEIDVTTYSLQCRLMVETVP
ncbi:hypothetical protein EI94DRAFT_1258579 [Lactarius quietus]|nr:hypothetical protein EI94DRAFT_1258579 [Lactarius quietus]